MYGLYWPASTFACKCGIYRILGAAHHEELLTLYWELTLTITATTLQSIIKTKQSNPCINPFCHFYHGGYVVIPVQTNTVF